MEADECAEPLPGRVHVPALDQGPNLDGQLRIRGQPDGELGPAGEEHSMRSAKSWPTRPPGAA